MTKKQESFDEIIKKISLYTRFKIFLENEYLNLIIEPNTCCSEEEFKRAEEWANKITEHLLYNIAQWTKDNKPEEKIYTKKDFESWINIRYKNKEKFHEYLRQYVKKLDNK